MEEIKRQLSQDEYLIYIEQWKEENKELINSGKCKKVFLDILPRWDRKGHGKEGSINWQESTNILIHFIYNNIESDIKIINYIKNRHPKLIIEYNNKTLEIYIDNFKKCQLGIILDMVTSEFKIEIGTKFKDHKRNITITGKEVKPNIHNEGKSLKYYNYKCNICGWSKGIILESSLLSGVGCSACGYNSKTIVENINSIYKTDPWMIPYIGEECAKTHTKCSNDKVKVTCPDCGRVKKNKISINNIYNRRSIGCSCSDKISYGEKLMFAILEQLGIIFWTQLNKTTFKWCDKYKYDFYFEHNEERYICEVHGLQHYQDAWDKLEKTQENDRVKKELALKNGIKKENYIVIDCRKSNLEWIRDSKDGILNSRLNELFDLSKVDWNKVEEFSLSNLVKIACEYKRNDPELTTTQIGQLMGISQKTIIRWLKQGNELGWCEYDAQKEKIRISSNSGKKNGKCVIMFKDKKIKEIFSSIHELERQSEKIFSIKLSYQNISLVAIGRRKHYKGFTFKYVQDLTQEEYIKYDIKNKLKELDLTEEQIKEIQENAKLNQAI